VRELGRIRLAQQHAAGGRQPIDANGALARDVVLHQARAEGRAQALGVEVVLDEEGHAFEWARDFSAR